MRRLRILWRRSELLGRNPALSFRTSDRPLPVGMAVPPGKGLLEISTGDRHMIYLDGRFVGRGPRRQLQLLPGTTNLRIELGGAEVTEGIDIQAGRRTRVDLVVPPAK